MLTLERPIRVISYDELENGEPCGEVALLEAPPGGWTEEGFLVLETNSRIELSDGQVEATIVPTERHELIVEFLYWALKSFVDPRHLGKVLFPGTNVRLWPGKIRRPDINFMFAIHEHRRLNPYWEGADLVMEVVSPDDPSRDKVRKRSEYAQAGIPEYWIVDPRDETIAVLTLEGKTYREYGVFRRGESATSVLLNGFAVEVTRVFDAAKQ